MWIPYISNWVLPKTPLWDQGVWSIPSHLPAAMPTWDFPPVDHRAYYLCYPEFYSIWHFHPWDPWVIDNTTYIWFYICLTLYVLIPAITIKNQATLALETLWFWHQLGLLANDTGILLPPFPISWLCSFESLFQLTFLHNHPSKRGTVLWGGTQIHNYF